MTHGPLEPPGPYAGIWYLRTGPLGHGRWAIRAYMTDDHPDGTVVESTSASPSDDTVLWRVSPDQSLRPRVSVAQWAVAGLPDLWLVEVPDTVDDRPGCSIVAFASDHHAPGSLLANEEFADLGLGNEQQAGAMRWWVDTAELDQVFVRPDLRRRHIGSWLAYAADAVHQHHGWPGTVTVPGRRTDLGQLGTKRHGARMAPWTERMEVRDPVTGELAP